MAFVAITAAVLLGVACGVITGLCMPAMPSTKIILSIAVTMPYKINKRGS